MSRLRLKPILWKDLPNDDGSKIVGSPFAMGMTEVSGHKVAKAWDPEFPRADELFQDKAGNLFLVKEINGRFQYKKFEFSGDKNFDTQNDKLFESGSNYYGDTIIGSHQADNFLIVASMKADKSYVEFVVRDENSCTVICTYRAYGYINGSITTPFTSCSEVRFKGAVMCGKDDGDGKIIMFVMADNAVCKQSISLRAVETTQTFTGHFRRINQLSDGGPYPISLENCLDVKVLDANEDIVAFLSKKNTSVNMSCASFVSEEDGVLTSRMDINSPAYGWNTILGSATSVKFAERYYYDDHSGTSNSYGIEFIECLANGAGGDNLLHVFAIAWPASGSDVPSGFLSFCSECRYNNSGFIPLQKTVQITKVSPDEVLVVSKLDANDDGLTAFIYRATYNLPQISVSQVAVRDLGPNFQYSEMNPNVGFFIPTKVLDKRRTKDLGGTYAFIYSTGGGISYYVSLTSDEVDVVNLYQAVQLERISSYVGQKIIGFVRIGSAEWNMVSVDLGRETDLGTFSRTSFFNAFWINAKKLVVDEFKASVAYFKSLFATTLNVEKYADIGGDLNVNGNTTAGVVYGRSFIGSGEISSETSKKMCNGDVEWTVTDYNTGVALMAYYSYNIAGIAISEEEETGDGMTAFIGLNGYSDNYANFLITENGLDNLSLYSGRSEQPELLRFNLSANGQDYDSLLVMKAFKKNSSTASWDARSRALLERSYAFKSSEGFSNSFATTDLLKSFMVHSGDDLVGITTGYISDSGTKERIEALFLVEGFLADTNNLLVHVLVADSTNVLREAKRLILTSSVFNCYLSNFDGGYASVLPGSIAFSNGRLYIVNRGGKCAIDGRTRDEKATMLETIVIDFTAKNGVVDGIVSVQANVGKVQSFDHNEPEKKDIIETSSIIFARLTVISDRLLNLNGDRICIRILDANRIEANTRNEVAHYDNFMRSKSTLHNFGSNTGVRLEQISNDLFINGRTVLKDFYEKYPGDYAFGAVSVSGNTLTCIFRKNDTSSGKVHIVVLRIRGMQSWLSAHIGGFKADNILASNVETKEIRSDLIAERPNRQILDATMVENLPEMVTSSLYYCEGSFEHDSEAPIMPDQDNEDGIYGEVKFARDTGDTPRFYFRGMYEGQIVTLVNSNQDARKIKVIVNNSYSARDYSLSASDRYDLYPNEGLTLVYRGSRWVSAASALVAPYRDILQTIRMKAGGFWETWLNNLAETEEIEYYDYKFLADMPFARGGGVPLNLQADPSAQDLISITSSYPQLPNFNFGTIAEAVGLLSNKNVKYDFTLDLMINKTDAEDANMIGFKVKFDNRENTFYAWPSNGKYSMVSLRFSGTFSGASSQTSWGIYLATISSSQTANPMTFYLNSLSFIRGFTFRTFRGGHID
jgi:hypothetical protein